MPSIYDIKPKFQQLLRPLCKGFVKVGITANQVTVAAIILSFLGGIIVFYSKNNSSLLYLLPAVLFIRMALNAIDGMLAKEFNMKTNLGAILNEIGDVVSDSALYLPFMFLPGIDMYLVITFVIIAIITEMIGVVAIQIGASRRYDGPMGKSDRAFALGLLSLLLALKIRPGLWINIYMGIVLFLTLVTVVNRASKALAEVKDV